jgi:hypothetical protein
MFFHKLETKGEKLHSLQFGQVGDNPVPPKSRERIGHLIHNPLLIVPVKGRVTVEGDVDQNHQN